MRPASARPHVQVFVCCNAQTLDGGRDNGCVVHGPTVYAALKREVAQADLAARAWITRTDCLGHCPENGCSVVVHPSGMQWTEVDAEDAARILDSATTPGSTPGDRT